MGTMGATCTKDGLSQSSLDALKSGIAFKANGMIEDVVKLHLRDRGAGVRLQLQPRRRRCSGATAPTARSTASLRTPPSAGRFTTSAIASTRTAATGMNPTAEAAHAEIDALRMQSLLHGLDAFKARGLQDKSIILWTNHIADGPSHSARNVPHIIWGNGGGYLKQGQYVDAGNVTNNKLWNTLITAAIRDKSTATVNFGSGTDRRDTRDDRVRT